MIGVMPSLRVNHKGERQQSTRRVLSERLMQETLYLPEKRKIPDPQEPDSSEDTVFVRDGGLWRSLDPSYSKECPECVESIKLRARVCRFCGFKYSDEQFAEEQSLFDKYEFDRGKRGQ